jgi:type I restriction enzyme S subunit
MELKPGYKQTEVGVIPEDWNVCSLTDLSLKITDGDHLTPKREPSGYYLLSARNVLNGRIDVRNVDYVGHAEYQRMKQRCGPEAGDILISCSGTIGRVAVVPQGLECVLVRSAALAKIDNKLANGSFIQFWLQGKNAQSQISGSVNQGAQPNLFLNQIERLRCPKPPLAEQIAIADLLSDLDQLLSDLDQLMTKKLQVRQAAMQELLTGKRRLPGFEGEWEVKRLGDVAPLQRGFDLPNPKLEDGPYPVVYSNGVMNHHATFQVKGPGVVTGRSGTIGKVHYVANDFWPHNTSLWVTSFRGNDLKFIFYLLSSMGIERFASGSGVPTLNRNDLHDQPIRIPSDTREQVAIAAVLTDLDTNLDASKQQLAKASALKQGMMQQLLTGKIRLT